MEFKKGDTVITKDGREHTVGKTDGRYVYFTDGSVYGLNHPDILEVKSKKKKKETEKPEEDE